MVLKSFAKINLSLLVNRKLPNGMHDIQSAYCLINIFDLINIKKIKNSKKDKVSITGSNSKFVSPSQNSVGKILILMRKFKLISSYYDVKIYKRIPVFAGLGGGTSNAASVLKFFIKNKIKDKLLNKIIKHLGSDLRLFFKYKKIYQKNLLVTKNFKSNHTFYFVLIYPFLKSSTKQIYLKLKKFDVIKNKTFYSKKSAKKLIGTLRQEKNSLEKIVISKFPVVKKILYELELIKNCQISRVTGSGSACFGLFLNKKDATSALRQIKRKFPKFWCVLCKTI